MPPDAEHRRPKRDQGVGSRRGNQVRGVPADPRPHPRIRPLRVRPRSAWMPAEGEPTVTLLLRHGQTAMSVQKRYAGRSDVPLTQAGIQQAAAAAKRLASARLDVIVTSPLQ